AVAGVVLARSVLPARPRRRRPTTRWRRIRFAVAVIGAVVWVAVVAWLRPFPAVEPALAAMASDDVVAVEQSSTRIVLTPADGPTGPAVLFHPGARVDPRAYAAVLRPLAEAGTRVVVVKQPLGIAFLATGSLGSARAAFEDADGWVVAGHSLGGTVASMLADEQDERKVAPVVGLLLWASYPATDLRESLTVAVLSVSGSQDGLATPAEIEASRAALPDGAEFVSVDGASHASFGDYGPQPGDGTPTIDADDARAQIAEASVAFVAGLTGSPDGA
ncbi:MAG: alpha/beta hydrolase, partial [Actinotalea sp.]|nr:alpha/beta hydrolase [Actinotalea sp.]